MKKVYLKHNPYKIETTIIVDGEEIKENSSIVQYLKTRFQLWVEQIPELLAEEYNDDEFEIIFHGTDLDYDDLKLAVKIAGEKNADLKFKIKKQQAREFGDKEKDLRTLFKKIQKLPFEELQSPALKNAFELAFNNLLEVNVVATMSAGKSTLINALLGKKLMPSKQGACTATITRVKDNDKENFEAVAYNSNKTVLEKYPCLDYEIMKSLNKDERVSEIYVEGDIPFVSAEEVALVLIDTPGPDNARDKRHGLVTAEALDKSSKMLVLFVMNGGKLHDEAQDNFLKRIAKSMSVGGKQSKERFLFVINKMDAYDEEDDDIEGETIPETIEYLEEMGIMDPNVFPVAAEPALLIRRYWDENGKEEKQKLYSKIKDVAEKLIKQEQLHLEKYARLSQGCQNKIDEELQKAKDEGDIFTQALIHSGIRGIEETINMYVTKYCRPAKITNVVNSFEKELESAEAFSTTLQEVTVKKNELNKFNSKVRELQKEITSKEGNEEFKKKLRGLNIKAKLKSELDKLTAATEGELTDFFDECPEEMERSSASYHIRNFAKFANDKQNEFQVAVEHLLKEDIEEKGNSLLQEYIKKLDNLSDEFSTKGLKINLGKYVKGKLAQIKEEASLLSESEDTRTEVHYEMRSRQVTKTYRRTGLDRLLHPTCWFDPTYQKIVMEPHPELVRNTTSYISRDKLSSKVVAPVREKIYKEKDNALKYADKETENIRNFFEKQFDAVDEILKNKSEELVKATSSQSAAKSAKKKAEELLDRLNQVRDTLNDILEI